MGQTPQEHNEPLIQWPALNGLCQTQSKIWRPLVAEPQLIAAGVIYNIPFFPGRHFFNLAVILCGGVRI